MNALIANRTPGATLYGASKEEKATLVLGKVAHYTLLLAVPFALHGGMAALTGWAAYVAAQVSVSGYPALCCNWTEPHHNNSSSLQPGCM